jgi:tyrosyl-tRNA synthetase
MNLYEYKGGKWIKINKITGGTIKLIDLVVACGIKSRSEARRLIEQGGVKIW